RGLQVVVKLNAPSPPWRKLCSPSLLIPLFFLSTTPSSTLSFPTLTLSYSRTSGREKEQGWCAVCESTKLIS
ncbi:hypothetical protein KUCAC02_000534, partial [Chaenocephalus aceratus]